MSPSSEINEVLRRHEQELMALPGVVGIYVGLLPDGKTQCLKVMLSKGDKATLARLPKSLDGFRVQPEVTGVIRPM